MFSGKSEELIRRVKRAVIARRRVQVFKPAIDDRFSSEHVRSHDGDSFDARPVRSSATPGLSRSIPASAVAEAAEDCARAGVKYMIVISSGLPGSLSLPVSFLVFSSMNPRLSPLRLTTTSP